MAVTRQSAKHIVVRILSLNISEIIKLTTIVKISVFKLFCCPKRNCSKLSAAEIIPQTTAMVGLKKKPITPTKDANVQIPPIMFMNIKILLTY